MDYCNSSITDCNYFIVADNPRTYWIILFEDETGFKTEDGIIVDFNTELSGKFHLYKTRKWARKIARETVSEHNCWIYRVIIPLNGSYMVHNEKELYAKNILIKNDKKYAP